MNIKNAKRLLYKKLYPTYAFTRGYMGIAGFAFQVIFWVFVLYILLPVLAILFRNMYGADLSMSDFIMLITAGFLVATLYETKKSNDQDRESNLRPIILRAGFIKDWENLKFTIDAAKGLLESPLEFRILKNMATNISGYIRINGRRYKLMFSHDMTRIGQQIQFVESWNGWIAPDNSLSAIYLEDKIDSETDLDNGITINYDDLEGNHYTTIEDEKFMQKSFKD